MLRYVPILFITGLVLELTSIIWVGRAFGVLTTLLLLFGSGIIGMSLIRRAGMGVAETFRSPVQNLSLQKGLASRTMLQVMSGFLFIVPGFFSDVVALLILLPPVQHWLASKVEVQGGQRPAGPSRRFETVIDAEAIEITGEIESPGGREKPL